MVQVEKHGQKIAQAEVERAEAKKVSARKAAKEAEESEQSAEAGAEDGANLRVKPDKGV